MRIILSLIFSLAILGCSRDEAPLASPQPERIAVSMLLPNDLNIERSLIFFFKMRTDGDTLIYHTEITGPTEQNNKFDFKLPAGYYTMVIIGNGDAAHIRSLGQYATSDMVIEYQDGTEPPDLYYGRILVNVGETPAALAGLLHLTARIFLTIQNVPAEVSRINVELTNNCSGVFLDLNKFEEAVDPPISKEVELPVAGSSPVIEFSSFPTLQAAEGSALLVSCYDVSGQKIYSGSSALFHMGGGEAITVSCSFDNTGNTFETRGSERNTGLPVENNVFLLKPLVQSQANEKMKSTESR